MKQWADTNRETPRPNQPGHRLRRWVESVLLHITAARAEAELRAMNPRELHDLGLDQGGIGYAARYGREG